MRAALLFLFLVSLGRLLSAEPPSDTSPTVSFAPFPLAPVRIHVWSAAGVPVGQAEMITPFPNDFPPSVVIGLEDARAYPALGSVHNTFEAHGE